MQGMLDFGDQRVLGALSLLSLLQTCPLQGEHSCLCTTTWRLSLFRPQLWLSWPLRWWAPFTGHLQKLCFGKLKKIENSFGRLRQKISDKRPFAGTAADPTPGRLLPDADTPMAPPTRRIFVGCLRQVILITASASLIYSQVQNPFQQPPKTSNRRLTD